MIFRGHEDATWEVKSTFQRQSDTLEIERNEWFGNALHQAFLDYVGPRGLIRPNPELLAEALSNPDIDPWFELLKEMQQHPEKYNHDSRFRGTNLLDWTRDLDVALAIASEHPEIEGMIYAVDAMMPRGLPLSDISVQSAFERMQASIDEGTLPGLPIIFHPRQQTAYERVRRQSPIYIAQIDLRYSLDHVWREYEQTNGLDEPIFRRVAVSTSVKREARMDLSNRGKTIDWLLDR